MAKRPSVRLRETLIVMAVVTSFNPALYTQLWKLGPSQAHRSIVHCVTDNAVPHATLQLPALLTQVLLLVSDR